MKLNKCIVFVQLLSSKKYTTFHNGGGLNPPTPPPGYATALTWESIWSLLYSQDCCACVSLYRAGPGVPWWNRFDVSRPGCIRELTPSPANSRQLSPLIFTYLLTYVFINYRRVEILKLVGPWRGHIFRIFLKFRNRLCKQNAIDDQQGLLACYFNLIWCGLSALSGMILGQTDSEKAKLIHRNF